MTLLRDMQQRGERRRERYPDLRLVHRLPATIELLASNKPAFLGVYTVSQQPSRWLLADAAVSLFGWEQSPTELARDYLLAKFPKTPRRKFAQVDACAGRKPPLLAVPGCYPDCVYVDIVSAYWSITRIAGWNVDYWPDRWLAQGADMDDFPLAANKTARNYLVSVTRADGVDMFIGGKLVHKPGNALRNASLYALVMDVLTGIALEARTLGAVYINTDGYIVREQDAQALMQVIEDWGLRARVKHAGDAVVVGAGSYSIGTHRNKTLRLEPAFYDNVEDADTRWLQQRFSALASRR